MLHVTFFMIYMIHKISVLFKITRILNCFYRSTTDLYFLKIIYKNMEENIIKDIINIFRLEKLDKETNDAAITG